ncbi:hypothetical protein AWV79_27020 [Cupriavidus sp. UYMMa02A]|nr:hypothetical protein AWV79_27020 [Cupriavidus sp. UYMMa02A]
MHTIFPWNIGAAYNKTSDKDIESLFGIIQRNPTPQLGSRSKLPITIKPLSNTIGLPPGSPKWKLFIDKVENHINDQWLNEPWEITKIKWGLIDTGAGSGGQFFSVLVHLDIFLEAAKCVIYALAMYVKENSEQFQFTKILLRYILKESFDAFEFLKDLGLAYMQDLGDEYFEAIDDPATGINELFEMSVTFVLDITRIFSWVKSLAPWNPAARFAQLDDSEVREIYELIQIRPTPIVG